jgi:hypothetical protein
VLLPRILAAGSAALVLGGCATASDDPGLDALRREAGELVPASSEVVDTREGACVQVSGNPVCVRIFLTADLPERRRADELERTARAAGWEVVSRKRLADGTAIELRREGYRAYAAVWGDARAAPCRAGQADRDCADEIQVLEAP